MSHCCFVSALSSASAGAGKVASNIQSMTGQAPLLLSTGEDADRASGLSVALTSLHPPMLQLEVIRSIHLPPGRPQSRLPGARPALCSAA